MLARQILLNPAEHDDAVQEVFIEIWKCAHRFDPSIASARAFVAIIARRRLIDRGRSEQVRVRGVVGLEAAETRTAPPSAAAAAEVAAERVDEQALRVREAITELKPQEQEAVRLAFGLGWSHQRIAEYMQQPLGTVKTNIRRALIRLRDRVLPTSTDMMTGGPRA